MSAVARAFSEERASVLATLIRQTGDFDLAEDAVQDAFVAALVAWERDGVPDRPGAWLLVAARRRAVDLVRRSRSQTERAARLAATLEPDAPADDSGPIEDDRLRLIFTCCHPALDLPARVALTLRTVGGLTTGEIARAFLVAEPTMAKRLVRAKRKIAEAAIRYRVPAADELPSRLRGVLRVVYVVFTAGYAAGGDAPVCAEAIRLGRLVCALLPAETEAWALLALMLLHDARRAARSDPGGRYVPLDRQDRARWDRDRIAEGLAALRRADRPGPYQLQAAIAALHLAERTDWAAIAGLYDRLCALAPSPVAEVGRAVAAGFADGPAAGLELLAPLLAAPVLRDYQPMYAAHADLLRRSGDREGAAAAYRRAIELTANATERTELMFRLGDVQNGTPVATVR
jgi:RNA polymerase sigma-70 factor (ECF subfamily)